MYTRTRVCGIVSIIQQASRTPSGDATPVIIIPHGYQYIYDSPSSGLDWSPWTHAVPCQHLILLY
ncbi:hypothetical protein Taro_011580 [Colocasia esculenta]|uniref:Uncharacterized protein n=1 Tax=Colocasia esculenta TaxID=4460 RepID=A0A843U6K6_COLES|nr:hypothetical protein [Colocasia esculenta]